MPPNSLHDNVASHNKSLSVFLLAVFLQGCGQAPSTTSGHQANIAPTLAVATPSPLNETQKAANEATRGSIPGIASVPTVSTSTPFTPAVGGSEAQNKYGSTSPPALKVIIPTSDYLRWSDIQGTWGGQKPAAGTSVVIPYGKKILLDESPPSLGLLTINGELIVEQGKNIDLTAENILLNGGALRAGSASEPFAGKFTVTLTAANVAETISQMGARAILNIGGILELFGKPPATLYSSITDHIQAGASTIPLMANTDWKTGDQVIISPTDYYGLTSTELLDVSSSRQGQITTKQTVQTPRWGKIQYPTATGMSLTPDPSYKAHTDSTPTMLDQRAVVANLSRNIIVQGARDAVWANQGFGAQVMIMGSNSQTVISGVELRRVGQAGQKGRYPIHFHKLSYDDNGTPLPMSGKRIISNNAIWESKNRCITLHGTSDTIVDNNICYDIAGHAVFLEDAVERRNQIVNNLVLKVRVPAQPLLESDTDLFTRGPSGFWITHPDNVVKGNRAADATGNGFWLAFPNNPLGIHKNAKNPNGSVMIPSRSKLGVFSDNISHSNNKIGLQLDWSPINDAGQTNTEPYTPTSDEGPDRYDENRLRFFMPRMVSYKNREAGFWNRVSLPTYDGWTSADNVGVSFSGAGANGIIKNSLVVGISLNNANTWKTIAPNEPVVAFASYHSTFDIFDNTVINFAYVHGKSSGAIRVDDYYINGIDRGTIRNVNNKLINTHPGYRFKVDPKDNWTLAGALWDPHGLWGAAGNYWTYDDPFLTSGANCSYVDSGGNLPGSNGMSCAAEYYGVGWYWTETSYRYVPTMPIKVSRIAPDNSIIGTWSVGDGWKAPKLGNMRSFSAMRGGKYLLEFPGTADNPSVPVPLIPAEFLQLEVTNAYRVNDEFVIGLPFSGLANVKVVLANVKGTKTLSEVGTLAAVEQSTGSVFWHDKAKNTVWLKAKTPAADAYTGSLTSDQNLYRYFDIRVDKL